MLCVKCGHEIVSGAAFCSFCGEKVARGEPGMDGPLYQAEVKKMLKSGQLIVYRDRTEFVSSSVQRAIFNYTGLVSVKKEWDHIDFITEDGRKASCPADRKCVHEAFLYIEQAVRPYLDQRRERLLSQGVRYSFPSAQGVLNEGVLDISADQAEFKSKSGKSDVVPFQDVKSVSAAAGTLDFSLFGGRMKSFAVSRELRDEVLAFVTGAVAPYLARRKEALLAQGIYFSFPHLDGGTTDILADRLEYRGGAGQAETVLFQDVRAVSVYAGTLELALTDGTSKPFSIDEDAGGEVLAFVKSAIEPYVTARTAGFDRAFGIDERIEINEERGVFHIIRQGGREITAEWPLDALTRCEWVENTELTALAGVVSGSIALFKSAAKAAGSQTVPEEDRISCAGAVMTVRAEPESETETVWFGIFTAGMSRSNKRYERYLAEWSGLSEYLKNRCPACELIEPVPPEPREELPAAAPPAAEEPAASESTAGGTERAGSTAGSAARQDDLGIAKYMEGVSRFIGNCATPMTIAFQGNRGSGESSIFKMLFNRLRESYGENLMWLNARQFSQGGAGEALSLSAGRKLVGLFIDENSAEAKNRAANIAAGVLKLMASAIASDSSAGDNLVDGIFDHGTVDSVDQLLKLFSRQVEVRTRGGSDKVVLFVDGLDQLTPARAVELLDAMRDFLACRGCVFVIAADYGNILSGARELYGESRAKRFFDEMFKMSFRVPASSYNVQNYVKSKFEGMGIQAGDGRELDLCAALIQHSVGRDPESIDRLFHSFQLLKDMVGEEVYESRYKRLALFALLCMQARFRDAYDYAARMRDRVTPEFLTGLCGESAQLWDTPQNGGGEREAYRNFGGVFAQVINLDGRAEISETECRAFAEVLELSCVTSR